MSLRPDPIGEIPAETARVARAAFPKGTLAMRLREEFDVLDRDEDFARTLPTRTTSWAITFSSIIEVQGWGQNRKEGRLY